MFFHHTLKPNELSEIMGNVEECFFTMTAKLINRTYQVAVYKYNKEYFVLSDSRIFKQIEGISDEIHGDENKVLPYIEAALEENLYFLVKEEYVRLDLAILTKLVDNQSLDVKYYEFIDM